MGLGVEVACHLIRRDTQKYTKRGHQEGAVELYLVEMVLFIIMALYLFA